MKISEIIVEDASVTPGGVGSGTHMFLNDEDEHELKPRVRKYENSFGRPRWEVLNWRGVRVESFDSPELAQRYLRSHKVELSEPVDEEILKKYRGDPNMKSR